MLWNERKSNKLVTSRLDLDETDMNGQTALKKTYAELGLALIRSEANLNIQNIIGSTAPIKPTETYETKMAKQP